MSDELNLEIEPQEELLQDALAKDVVKTTVTCPGCNKEYKNAQGLAIHSKKCGQSSSLSCAACHSAFTTKYRLTTHLKTCKVIKQQEEKILEEKKQAELLADCQSQIQDLKLEIQKTKEDHLKSLEERDTEWKSRMDSEIQMREMLISHLQKSYAQLQDERKDLIGKRDRPEVQLAEAMKEMSLDKHRITDLATKFLEKAMATM